MRDPNLIERALARAKAGARGVPLIAVAGAQGSGKSTLAAAFAARHPDAAVFSLDDYYLDSASRRALAARIHPLLELRGVPGTHDLAALNRTLDDLIAGAPTRIRRFDKLADEPLPPADWTPFTRAPSAIVMEGWCLGALAQTEAQLAAPINDLEQAQDAEAHWRCSANAQLAGPYQALFARFDAIVFLAAPTFDVVLSWRREQEERARGRALTADEAARLDTFVGTFERITRHMLAGGRRAEIVARLDRQRVVREITET